MNFENVVVPGESIERGQYLSKEGHLIELSWKKFETDQASLESGVESEKDSAVIFLPGWSMGQTARASSEISQALADKSRLRTFAINTNIEAEGMGEDPMNEQAEVILQFIKEQGIKELTLLGYSQGGDKAIDLAAMLKDETDISLKGVILVDSTGLYQQDKKQLSKNFINSALWNTTASVLSERFFANYSKVQRKIIFSRGVDALVDIVGTFVNNLIKQENYKAKLDKEIGDMANVNNHLADIHAPVVIISGDKDLISNPNQIVPPEEEAKIVAELENGMESKQFVDPREKYLQEHLLPNSPYVRMIIGKKMGHHSLPFFRPESIAKVGLYALERYHRKNKS